MLVGQCLESSALKYTSYAGGGVAITAALVFAAIAGAMLVAHIQANTGVSPWLNDAGMAKCITVAKWSVIIAGSGLSLAFILQMARIGIPACADRYLRNGYNPHHYDSGSPSDGTES